MSDRAQQKRLQDLYAAGIPVYSFSKVESMQNCPYEAYLTYVKGMRDQALPGIYGELGGRVHDTLEEITNGTKTEADLLPDLQKKLEELELVGICFPKGSDGSDSIKKSWMTDMEHFCKTYKAPKGTFETEQFFLYKTPHGHYLQGYIDLTKIRADGTLEIYDYKTSTRYTGEDIKSHSRQLTLYALGKEQEGYEVKNIAWIFLKYCEVTYLGRKTVKSKEDIQIKKIIERKNLVKDLANEIRRKLSLDGVDEVDIGLIVDEALEKNEIPTQVADQFKVLPYVCKYDLTDETKAEAAQYFDDAIERWETLEQRLADGEDVNELFPPLPFVKVTKAGKEVEDTFYHNCLCGYRNICPHLQHYNEQKAIEKEEDEDLFS